MFSGPAGLPIGFGSWAIGQKDWGPMDERTGKRLFQRAWERGFRHFDLAESYGNGRSELLFGQALRTELRTRRDECVVATKSVLRQPQALERHVQTSLRRMGISRIDLFYIHWPREGLSLEAGVEQLVRMQESGQIGAIGVCNLTREQLASLSGYPIAAHQFGYSALWRAPERMGLLPADAKDLTRRCVAPRRVAYSPLAQGLLSRPWPAQPGWAAGDHRIKTPLFAARTWPAVHAAAASFVKSAVQRELHPAACALAWSLRRTDATVVGARTTEHVDTLADGLQGLRNAKSALQDVFQATEEALRLAADALPRLDNMFGYTPSPCRSC